MVLFNFKNKNNFVPMGKLYIYLGYTLFNYNYKFVYTFSSFQLDLYSLSTLYSIKFIDFNNMQKTQITCETHE